MSGKQDLCAIATWLGEEEVQHALLLGLGAGGTGTWRTAEQYGVYNKAWSYRGIGEVPQ